MRPVRQPSGSLSLHRRLANGRMCGMNRPSNAAKPPCATARRDSAELSEFEVVLPRHLRRFVPSVHASLIGPEDASVVILMGGISADRFPARTVDGQPGWWSGLAGEG